MFVIKYEVTITETLQRVVTVEANSLFEAEELVQEQWNAEKYVLSADDFVEAIFNGNEVASNEL